MPTRRATQLMFLGVLLIVSCVWSVTSGPVSIPFSELAAPQHRTIVYLRLLRMVMGIIAGMGLAVSGLVLQAILRNPLAEPYLLGTSSGAGLGAVVALALGISQLFIPAAAFAGAMLSMAVVYVLARTHARIPQESLILAGVVVSVACSAIIVFLIALSGNDALFGMTWWLWGSLQVYDARMLALVAGVVCAGIAVISVFSQDLNAISVGEEDALHLGVDVEFVKRVMVLITAAITAALVAICGIIGFVGLMIPHMMRMMCGPHHRMLIPATCLGAASFVLICDVLARIMCPPIEIPIGAITALLGAPLCMVLMRLTRSVR